MWLGNWIFIEGQRLYEHFMNVKGRMSRASENLLRTICILWIYIFFFEECHAFAPTFPTNGLVEQPGCEPSFFSRNAWLTNKIIETIWSLSCFWIRVCKSSEKCWQLLFQRPCSVLLLHQQDKAGLEASRAISYAIVSLVEKSPRFWSLVSCFDLFHTNPRYHLNFVSFFLDECFRYSLEKKSSIFNVIGSAILKVRICSQMGTLVECSQ